MKMESMKMISMTETFYSENGLLKIVYKGIKLISLYVIFIFACFCLCFACETYYHKVCCPLHMGLYHGISSCILKSTSFTCYASRTTSDYMYRIIVKLYFDFYRKFF